LGIDLALEKEQEILMGELLVLLAWQLAAQGHQLA
jgi:hypothetical protein